MNSRSDDEHTGRTLLEDMSDNQIRTLLHYTDTMSFLAGEALIVEGELDCTLYILTRGEVEVIARDRQTGDPIRVAAFRAGVAFGEVAFFDRFPRTASVLAVTDGELIKLGWESFQRLMNDEPRLVCDLLMDLGRTIAVRFRQSEILYTPK